MSAEVASLANEEVFWFLDEKFRRFHAFELLNGELEEVSLCAVAPIDVCADVPENDVEARKGRGCVNCLLLASVTG